MVKPDFKGKRVAIVGVGNELKGDDAAGLLVVRFLKNLLVQRGIDFLQSPIRDQSEYQAKSVFLIEAGLAPENFSGSLRLFRPDIVLLIDAANLGAQVGGFLWLERDRVTGFGGSTHLLPLSILADFLVRELNCEIYFIGIQPGKLAYDAPKSRAVRKSVERIASDLAKVIAGN